MMILKTTSGDTKPVTKSIRWNIYKNIFILCLMISVFLEITPCIKQTSFKRGSQNLAFVREEINLKDSKVPFNNCNQILWVFIFPLVLFKFVFAFWATNINYIFRTLSQGHKNVWFRFTLGVGNFVNALNLNNNKLMSACFTKAKGIIIEQLVLMTLEVEGRGLLGGRKQKQKKKQSVMEICSGERQ